MPIILDGTNGLDSPDLNITGTGARITGDFSNATIANRVAFQSSTTNGNTIVTLIPNGTSTISQFQAFGGNDIDNTSQVQFANVTNNAVIAATRTGTGTFGNIVFNTGGSESLRISATSKAVILAGGNTSANGTGITFPATQSASSDANTLDDYEEGSWTPTLTGWNSITYVVRVGLYTKIGNQVTCWFDISVSAGTSTAGGVLVTGLPFTARANSVGGGMTSYADLPVSDRSYYAAYPSGSAINFYYFVSGGTTVSNANISGTRYLQGCVTYQV
jgi:hypothetical protein